MNKLNYLLLAVIAILSTLLVYNKSTNIDPTIVQKDSTIKVLQDENNFKDIRNSSPVDVNNALSELLGAEPKGSRPVGSGFVSKDPFQPVKCEGQATITEFQPDPPIVVTSRLTSQGIMSRDKQTVNVPEVKEVKPVPVSEIIVMRPIITKRSAKTIILTPKPGSGRKVTKRKATVRTASPVAPRSRLVKRNKQQTTVRNVRLSRAELLAWIEKYDATSILK